MTAATLAELRSLADKYRTLAELRRAKADGEVPPERAFFRDLAKRFPSALSELDRLPLSEIDARATALERAADGQSPPEEWMHWLHDYHALLRVALALRMRDTKKSAQPISELALKKLQARERVTVSTSFVQGVQKPPQGRLMVLVLNELAQKYGERSNAIADHLFPRLQRLRTAVEAK